MSIRLAAVCAAALLAAPGFAQAPARPLTPLDDAAIKSGSRAHKADLQRGIKGESQAHKADLQRGIKGEDRAHKDGDSTTGILIGGAPRPDGLDASKANPAALQPGPPAGVGASSQFKYGGAVNDQVQKVQPGAQLPAVQSPALRPAAALPAVQTPQASPALPAVQSPATQSPALQQTAPALQTMPGGVLKK